MSEIEEKIEKCFQKVFKGKVEFADTLDRKDAKLWDSLHHVQLLVALEKEFKLRFDGSDAVAMNNVQSIISVIKNKSVSYAS